jgi:hypothetical protein
MLYQIHLLLSKCPNEHDIAQNQITVSCHCYRKASSILNMYDYAEEDYFHGEQPLVGQGLPIIET